MKVQFTPEPLLDCQKLHYMGLELSDKPQVIFNWNWTGTVWQPQQWDSIPVVNRGCIRTDKAYVDKIFKQVYGYSSEATGVWAVEKSNSTNGAKDCRIVNSMQKREGYFYQKPLLDCTRVESKLTEYRITIMDYEPVIVLLKHKTVSIENLIGRVDGYEFSNDCPELVNEFCKAYPLEYGELDGCYYDDRFYIYDVNPTPGDAAFARMPKEQSETYKNLYKHHLYRWLTRLVK